ncbi:uncharacterized protein LOC109537861 [Dendroctonus ponderosae]|uniref:Allatostatin CC n=1 Tax=Dendroctonus ponderosae TaxID=77166 RepID=A0AAR5PH20_DENPD|nr:uncharacterized protein LOC109537861 [Dendroctonus ponderosae]XP_048519929.1 uncharacterized protein LOC109537861 [Dendroctonus ponderosae]
MHMAIVLVAFHCLISTSPLKEVSAIPIKTSQLMEKRSAIPDRINEDYPEYPLGLRYDEYPMIVPKKRTALLVNRLMVALKDALEEEEREKNPTISSVFGSSGNLYSDDVRTMDLQRRGHQPSLSNGQNKPRLYWRCYFNAVTCF